MPVSAFGRNVKALREQRGLTQMQLANELGVIRLTINKWESGSIAKPRQTEVIERLKSFFNVTDEELFGYQDGYYAKLHGLTQAPPGAIAVRGVPSVKVPVRVLGAAHAGDPTDAFEYDDETELPEALAKRHPRCFALHINGTCMNRNFTDRDLVFVDPDQEPQDGSIALMALGGEFVVRRLKRGSTSAMLVAESTEEWPDILIGPKDEATPMGTVFWWQSRKELP